MSSRRRLPLVCAAALGLLALVVIWSARPPATETAGIGTERPALPVAAPASAGSDRGAQSREQVAAPASESAPSSRPSAHVRGRCVDEGGSPLEACVAKLDGWGRDSGPEATLNEKAWRDPAPITTGADGQFDFAILPPPGLQFTFDVQCAGRVPRTGRWGKIEPEQVIDLGDVALGLGHEVSGMVVDEAGGAPVAKVPVLLCNLPLPLGPGMAANDTRHGFSAEDGRFRIGVPVPAGTWPLRIDAAGLRLVAPDRVTVPVAAAEPLLVTVRRMPSIEGIVVDESGAPVKGVHVTVKLGRSGLIPAYDTGVDGTFRLFAVDARPEPVRIEVNDPGPCEPGWAGEDRLWDWGTKGVRIELLRALALELTVVERESGAPVTRYAVSCYGQKATPGRQSQLRLSGDHPAGRVTVDRVWRGANKLRVVPLDPALVPSPVLEFDAASSGIAPMRVELERLRAASVRAETEAGVPVAGTKIEVIVKGTFGLDASTWVQSSRGGEGGSSSDPKVRFHELVSTAVTGSDGRAALFAPAAQRDLVVRATGEHPPVLVDPATFAAGQDLVVVVPRGGGIVGTVALKGLEPGRVAFDLTTATGQQVHAPGRPANRLAADGSFALRGLAPGRYRLRLAYYVTFRSEHGGSGDRVDMDVPVPEIVVEPGRDTVVRVDATTAAPAVVHGRVLLDGLAPSPARVFLRREHDGRFAQFGQFVPRADGTFEAAGLLPGKYRLGLVTGDFQAGEGSTLLDESSFELSAGQELTREFALIRKRLVITVLQPDGKTPAAGLVCYCQGRNLGVNRTTDKDGRLVFDPAPAGRVTVQPLKLSRVLGPVEIPEGKTSHEATVTLPAEGK